MEEASVPFLYQQKRAARIIALAIVLVSAFMLINNARAAVSENSLNSLRLQIDRLESGVQAEEAIRAVKRLQYTYGHYFNDGLWADLADLFTDNAVGEFQTGIIAGKNKLRLRFMELRTSLGLAKGQLNLHLLLQPIITLGADGKTAKGTWHELRMLGQFSRSASWLGGVYENDYVLERGVWKISRLRFFEQYKGAYEEFGHHAPPRWNIPYHFEAAHVGVTIPKSALQSLPLSNSSREKPAIRIARLSQRVQRLSDETQVQNLQHIYGYYLDRKMWDDVADLFAEDGTFEEGQKGVYIGKSHIRRALEVFYGNFPLSAGELFDHLNLATVVTVEPDGLSACARTSQLSMLGVNGKYARWEAGIYENEFVKQNGIWKIRAVRYYSRMAADYDKGWAENAMPAPAASKDFPPDRMPTHVYKSYPESSYMAFHYVNPVTGRPVIYPSGTIARVPMNEESSNRRMTEALAPSMKFDALIEELGRKLDAVIAVDAVENLNSSYGYYIDESAWDSMADTFASSGSKEITGAGVYVGQARIRKVLNLRGPRGGRTPDFFTIHQLTQPVIHISEDGNSAKARLRLFQCGGNADGSSGSWIGGIYENTAVKENGEWKFGVQDLHHIYNASYRNGWARIGAATRVAAEPDQSKIGRDTPGGGIQQGLGGAASPLQFAVDFPPDKPIRSKQYAFPQIIEPAFHYKNPVTGRMPPELLP
jgi:hypothetical protein